MTRFKKISLLVAGIGLLAMALFALLGTRQVHAFVATMVQVANTAANPVPVTQAPTATTQIVSLNTTLTVDGPIVEQGPYDVSPYSNIRFYADPPAVVTGTINVMFILTAVDANGNQFTLDILSKSEGGSVTGAYATPGTLLKVRMRASCSRSPCSTPTIPANFTIYGR
jgi:hypothetical protein